MSFPTSIRLSAILLTLPLGLAFGRALAEETPVRFGRDVLPILSDRCFHCHGPDETHREADLRLDLEAEAKADRGGFAAVSPGDLDGSEVIHRITTEDADLLMPPADSHRKPLTEHEVDILKKWIRSGAQWGKHWAFEKLERPQLPNSDEHPIDQLVRRRLAQLGISSSPKAPAHTLARRLAFDLTGLPPTADQVASLEQEDSAGAYDRLVDQLLASPHYGERMAMWWLDAARYSDTDGFQADEKRTNWPWRDWVVQSFNSNMPFDQFTVEQLAGDLLPNASADQRLATCFHRNHQTNGEGGRDPEESRVEYVIDRVNTTGTVWLGLTLGCCQCHSHKFDPISQKEYYQLTAFFNSIDETGQAGSKAKPYLKYQSPLAGPIVEAARRLVDTRNQRVQSARQQAETAFEHWLEEQLIAITPNYQPWMPLKAEMLGSTGGTALEPLDDLSVVVKGPNPDYDDYTVRAASPVGVLTAIRLEVLPDPSHPQQLLGRGDSGSFIITCFKLQIGERGQSQFREIEFGRAIADSEATQDNGKPVDQRHYGQVGHLLYDDPRNGWTVPRDQLDKPHEAILMLAEPVRLTGNEVLHVQIMQDSDFKKSNLGRFRLSVTDQPAEVIAIGKAMPLERLAQAGVASTAEVPRDLRDELREQFLATYEPYQEVKQSLDRAEAQLRELEGQAGEVSVMVMAERKEPRPTFVLERGAWDQHGERVAPGVPAAVLDWPAERTRTRLDLAHWILAPENPLTARVVVNQLWQLCFGAGLVRTPEDFGLQGEVPMHPELLDWLAVEFMESGWNVQHVMRLIVTSETYQQSSDFTPQLLEIDPENELLARAPRFRLPSWMIRDASLAASGLLDTRVGGPCNLPYQPAGVWEAQFKGRLRYEPSQGDLQFRRTVYAFWRRTSTPTYLFDVAPRRTCELRPRRTNTPLHALTLLNDQGQLEAARSLAKRALAQQTDEVDRIDWMARQVLLRTPTDVERKMLLTHLDTWLSRYEDSEGEAAALLAFGQPELRVQDRVDETAAYTVLASLMLNLDEALNHE